MLLQFNATRKFQLLHAFTHTVAALGLAWMFYTGNYQWLWVSLVFFLYSGIVGVNISLHRFYSHRSFKTGYWREQLLLVSSFLPMLGSPAAWCSVHTYHHRWSDTDKDPHSPLNAGKLGAWFTQWPKMKIPLSYFRPLFRNKGLRFLHRHYFKLIVAYVLVLAILDWRLVPFMFALPAVGCFHGAASVAVLPHIKFPGNYRNYDTRDNSRNSWLTWVLSLGEGWHNNHHHKASNYRHGEKWWEIDVSAFLIEHLLKVNK